MEECLGLNGRWLFVQVESENMCCWCNVCLFFFFFVVVVCVLWQLDYVIPAVDAYSCIL